MPNTAKQGAIRKAWLEFLSEEDFKKLVLDEGGFSNYQCRRYIHQSRWNDLYSRFTKNTKSRTGSDLIYRPKSLQGIENNNGWIRIESKEDLPKLQGYDFDTKYWTIVDGEMRDDIRYNVAYKQWQKINGCRVTEMNVSHYQPIVKPEKPIY